MKVNVNGRLYLVKWFYSNPEDMPEEVIDPTRPYYTHCEIIQDERVLASSRVNKAIDEEYSKEKARQFSLGKAINKLFPYETEYNDKTTPWKANMEAVIQSNPNMTLPEFLRMTEEVRAEVIQDNLEKFKMRKTFWDAFLESKRNPIRRLVRRVKKTLPFIEEMQKYAEQKLEEFKSTLRPLETAPPSVH